jgi:hypothetical protein
LFHTGQDASFFLRSKIHSVLIARRKSLGKSKCWHRRKSNDGTEGSHLEIQKVARKEITWKIQMMAERSQLENPGEGTERKHLENSGDCTERNHLEIIHMQTMINFTR